MISAIDPTHWKPAGYKVNANHTGKIPGFDASLREIAQKIPRAGVPPDVAPAVGFEPTTNRLTADRSTTELRWITI